MSLDVPFWPRAARGHRGTDSADNFCTRHAENSKLLPICRPVTGSDILLNIAYMLLVLLEKSVKPLRHGGASKAQRRRSSLLRLYDRDREQ